MTSTKGLPDSSGSFDVPLVASYGAPASMQPPLPPPLVLPPVKKEPPKSPPPPAKARATPPPAPPAPPSKPALPTKPAPRVVMPPVTPHLAPPLTKSPTNSSTRPPTKSIPSGAPAPRSVTVTAEPERPAQEADEIQFSIQDLYRDSPAWLTSLVIHMVVVIILGLIYIAPKKDEILELVASLAVHGNNTELTNGPDIATEVPPNLDEPPVYIPDGKPVEDPIATPMTATPTEGGFAASDPSLETSSPMVGVMLSGREVGSKKNLAIKFGATKGTLDSLALALEWIARNQQKNGSWSLQKPYSKTAPYENINAATAMAMLALQGDGNTHLKGQYQRNVAAGLKVLLRSQAGSGSLIGADIGEHQMMYTHAFATIALCELYGMTQDSLLKDPCEKAVKFLVQVQSPEGGWRYRPGNDSDTSVTGWCVMALQSARAAKIEVPNDCLKRVGQFLNSVESEEYGYSYLPRLEPTFSMTAEGLLCRQLLGMKRNDPRLGPGVATLLRSDSMTWETDKNSANRHSVYGWYYATQVIHHYGGKEWENWNKKLRVVLPTNQIKNGPERGSWPPDTDFYGEQAGRLYQTCLCAYMLEVYWRHLPLYKEVYDGTVKATD